MTIAKVLAKGQIVIPKEIREKMNLKPGDRVEITATAEGASISTIGKTCTHVFKGAVKGKLTLKELARLYAEKP